MPVIFDQLDTMISSMQISIRINLRDNSYLNEEDADKLSDSEIEKLNEILTKTHELTEILMK